MSELNSFSTLTNQPRLDKYGYNTIAKHIGMAVMICAPLFIGAGTVNWNWACYIQPLP
jgi:hypothetical protein